MANTIKVGDLAKEVEKLTAQYSLETLDDLTDVCKETASQVLPDLRTTSPKRTGRYSRGWRSTVEKTRHSARAVSHNTQYRLVHLLEFGHATRSGGRTKAIPHAAPAQDRADNLFLENLRRKIEANQ